MPVPGTNTHAGGLSGPTRPKSVVTNPLPHAGGVSGRAPCHALKVHAYLEHEPFRTRAPAMKMPRHCLHPVPPRAYVLEFDFLAVVSNHVPPCTASAAYVAVIVFPEAMCRHAQHLPMAMRAAIPAFLNRHGLPSGLRVSPKKRVRERRARKGDLPPGPKYGIPFSGDAPKRKDGFARGRCFRNGKADFLSAGPRFLTLNRPAWRGHLESV